VHGPKKKVQAAKAIVVSQSLLSMLVTLKKVLELCSMLCFWIYYTD